MQAQRAKDVATPNFGVAKGKKNKKWRLGQMDIPLLTIVMVLLLFGLVMLFSASYPTGYMRRADSFAFIADQLKFAVLGILGMFAASFFDYRLMRKFAWPVMTVALILLFVALLMPAKNGVHRWVWLNPISQRMGFQPSEIVKFAIILLFARLIALRPNKMKTFQYGFLPFVLLLGAVAVLLILEPHLSCTLLVLGVGIFMMFAGGASIKYFLMAGGGLLVALYLTISQFPELVPYATDRINTWLDVFSAPPAEAHQTIQGLIAVGTGGITGKGIGKSVQKFLYLPEAYNDYIFAVICEELGMVGGLVVIILFVLLLFRGLYIALRAKDTFGSMLVIGISVQIALQALLHVAVNLNAIPSTGISLPFFSYGGTSLCMLLGQIGVVLSVSRRGNLASAKSEMQTGQSPGVQGARQEASQ